MKTDYLVVLVILCRGLHLQGHPLSANNETRYGKEISLSCQQDEVLCSALGALDTFGCVKKTSLCDGRNDCPVVGSGTPQPFPTGADEDDRFCTRICKERNEIQCPRDGNCISKNKVCDGTSDCCDKWDENNCCGSLGFSCEDPKNICVSNRMRCDGIKDCSNGLDESPKAGCDCDQYTEFTCTDRSKCIKLSENCNKISDCLDSSDEKGCRFCNEETEFACTTGDPACIPKIQVCDRTRDCWDASDEGYCPPGFQQFWRDQVPFFHELIGVPEFPAFLLFGKIKLESNDDINTDDILEPPVVDWKEMTQRTKTTSGDLGKQEMLYTVMMFDMSIQGFDTFPDGQLNDKTMIHWMKINIKGTNSKSSGDEIMEYAPGFAFRTCYNGEAMYGRPCYWDSSKLEYGYYINGPDYKHTMVTLIFRQMSGLIKADSEQIQVGCNADRLLKRYITFALVQDIINKYKLVLAQTGHFFRVPWTPIADRLLCQVYTKCSSAIWPSFPPNIIIQDGNLEGNNPALPECAPFTGDPTARIDYLALKN